MRGRPRESKTLRSRRMPGPMAPFARWRSGSRFRQERGWLNPLRQPDRQARAGLDERGDQLVAGRLCGAVCNRGVAVAQFVGADFGDRLGEGRVAISEPRELAAVMLVDDLLDRDGA